VVSQSVLNRAAQVIRSVRLKLPADAALRATFSEHRHWSPDERRQVARAVFSYFRWLQWLDRKSALQTQIAGALEYQERFETKPVLIKPQALAALAVPEWLKEEMDLPAEFLRQLQREPALWLRARSGQEERVRRELIDAEPVDIQNPPGGPAFSALRYNGSRDLFQQESFREGCFEIQDLGSQWVGQLCAPKPGEAWWDACAGEGGKTLHLADQMKGTGVLWATDRSQRRLERLKQRTARAQVFNYRAASWDGSETLPTDTRFDGILLDAPCSGVGTWRRNPHARWTTMHKDVTELAAVQLGMLNACSKALKVGGRLVYAVCTLTRSETTANVEAFGAANPEFELEWSGFLPPQDFDCNGMYAATWRKK